MAENFRDHRTYILPLFRALAGRGAVAPAEIYEKVADAAGVTKEEREVLGERETDNPVYANRIQFARQSLIDAGLLIGSSDPHWTRGVWQLNAAGESLARRQPDDRALDAELRRLAAEGARKRAQERKRSRTLAGLDDAEVPPNAPSSAPTLTPTTDDEGEGTETTISELVDDANEVTTEAMLAHVRAIDDFKFEHLVARVLRAALRADSVEVTPRSRDGGIDGYIYFDDLKLRLAVFQAKRYGGDGKVGRPEVDAFSTAARRKKASHALFVTSGGFSKEAIEAARDEGIRAIDGFAFVQLMALHEIGLRARKKYVLYEIDPAWSVEET
jgi:restriction system protein